MIRALLLVLAAAWPATGRSATEAAVFAGGCFWCVEADFDKVPGVVETVSGYTGGALEAPTYAQVSAGGTGHREAVRIVFDPDRVSYAALVATFLRTVDPTDPDGQFCDRGPSYATAIFVDGPDQRAAAERAKAEAATALGAGIVTPVEPLGAFWPAEAYHQDYHETNPLKYQFYRWRCGRDARVEAVWGAPPAEALGRLD